MVLSGQEQEEESAWMGVGRTEGAQREVAPKAHDQPGYHDSEQEAA